MNTISLSKLAAWAITVDRKMKALYATGEALDNQALSDNEPVDSTVGRAIVLRPPRYGGAIKWDDDKEGGA